MTQSPLYDTTASSKTNRPARGPRSRPRPRSNEMKGPCRTRRASQGETRQLHALLGEKAMVREIAALRPVAEGIDRTNRRRADGKLKRLTSPSRNLIVHMMALSVRSGDRGPAHRHPVRERADLGSPAPAALHAALALPALIRLLIERLHAGRVEYHRSFGQM